MRIGWPRSLIARILLIELATLGIALLTLPPLTTSLLRGVVARYQNNVLRVQAQAVLRGLRRNPRGGLSVELNPALKPIFAVGYDGRAYMVVDQAGELIAASPFGSMALASSAPRKMSAAPFHTRHFIGLSVPVRAGNRLFWIVITQDQNGPGVILDDVVRVFLPRYLAVVLPLLLLLPIVNSLVVRRLVMAVRAVSHRAAAIDVHSLHNRLAATGLPAEIVPLVQATNSLIERLETSFRQQAEFSANVAHELRTPLATLQLQLDAVTEQTVRERLFRQVDRLSHVLSQLRDLASLETLEGDMERVELRALATRVVTDMAPWVMAQEHSIEVSGSEGSLLVIGSATLIELALRNLIVNAVRHTPLGVRIEVIVGSRGSLAVRDNGHGIVAENLHLLARRFWRADHERSDSAGIGLSIVQRIIEVHRGTMQVRSNDPHGAYFIMQFRWADDE